MSEEQDQETGFCPCCGMEMSEDAALEGTCFACGAEIEI